MKIIIGRKKDYVILVMPIYRTRIYVLDITKSVSVLPPDIVISEIDDDVVGCMGDVQRITNKKGSTRILIRLPRKYNEYLVWHECIHAASIVLENAGMGRTDTDCEPIAYTAEYIAKMVQHAFYGKRVDFDK